MLALWLLLFLLCACGEATDPLLSKLRPLVCAERHREVIQALRAAQPTTEASMSLVRVRYEALSCAALGEHAAVDDAIARHEVLLKRAPQPWPLERALDFADLAHTRRVLPGTTRLLQQLGRKLAAFDGTPSSPEPFTPRERSCGHGRNLAQARALVSLRLGTGALQQALFAQARTELDLGIRQIERAGQIADRHRDRSYHALLYNNRAELSFEEGKVQDSLRDRKTAIALASQASAHHTLALAQGGLAMTALEAEVTDAEMPQVRAALHAAEAQLGKRAQSAQIETLRAKLRSLDALLLARSEGEASRAQVQQRVASARAAFAQANHAHTNFDRLGIEARSARALFLVGDAGGARTLHMSALDALMGQLEDGADTRTRRGAMTLYQSTVARALQQAVALDDAALALHAMERSKDVVLLQRFHNAEVARLPVPESVGLDDVSRALAPDQAFVHVDHAFGALVWLIITDSKVVLRSAPALDVLSLLANVETLWKGEGDADDLLARLYQRLLDPIEADLHARPRIVLSPREGMHNVPWPALRDRQNKFWVESHAVTLVPSAGTWLTLQKRTTTARNFHHDVMLAVGSSHFDPEHLSQVAGLPAKTTVVEHVAELAGLSSDVLVMTAHGSFDVSSPERSFLQLVPTAHEPGKWRLTDIAQAKLSTRVVLLQACDASRSVPTSGDEGDSFVRAFLVGGARAVISPLAELERDFSDRVLQTLVPVLRKGVGPAEALARMQRAMLRGEYGPSAADPRRWGMYVASGAGF